jgi:hypothetical protein
MIIDIDNIYSNISAISWRPVLVMKEAVRTTDRGQAFGNLYHLQLRVEYTLAESGVRHNKSNQIISY